MNDESIIFRPYEFVCRCCGKTKTLILKCADVAEYESANRRHIQDIFPYVSPEDRELMISATCGECWKKIFG